MTFATKPVQHYPPHLRHVATLPWVEIRIFCRYLADIEENAYCIFIVSNVVIHTHFLIFLAFKIASVSPY